MRELSLQKRLGHASPESVKVYTRSLTRRCWPSTPRRWRTSGDRRRPDGGARGTASARVPGGVLHLAGAFFNAGIRARRQARIPVIKSRRYFYDRFLKHWPDLEEWFAAPLLTRLGLGPGRCSGLGRGEAERALLRGGPLPDLPVDGVHRMPMDAGYDHEPRLRQPPQPQGRSGGAWTWTCSICSISGSATRLPVRPDLADLGHHPAPPLEGRSGHHRDHLPGPDRVR